MSVATINTSGKNDTRDHTIGRGILYLVELDSDDADVGGLREIGNVTQLTTNAETETLEHKNTQTGLSNIDIEIVTSQKQNFAFITDELSAQNLALFLQAELVSVVNPAIAGFTGSSLVTPGQLQKSVSYFIYDVAGTARSMDNLAGNVTIETTAGAPVTLVEGTDYELTARTGQVFILDSPAIDTAITASEGLTVDVAATAAAAPSYTDIRGYQGTGKSYRAVFIGENPADGNRLYEVEICKTTLRPEGDTGFISDDWLTTGFAGVAEKNNNAKFVGRDTINMIGIEDS